MTIESPLVSTTLPLPDTTHADVAIDATLVNQEPQAVSGTLRVTFGDIRIDTPITLGAADFKTLDLDPTTSPALHLTNPKLWWPNRLRGSEPLSGHDRFSHGQSNSDTKSFQVGIRQFTYDDSSGGLKIFVNGRRFIARGGNWGFSESMLRYRSARVRHGDALPPAICTST